MLNHVTVPGSVVQVTYDKRCTRCGSRYEVTLECRTAGEWGLLQDDVHKEGVCEGCTNEGVEE